MKWGNVGTKIKIRIHFRALKPKNCPIPLVRDSSNATYLHDHHRTETIEFRALSPYGFPSFLLALLAICVEQHSPPPTCHCFFFAYLSSSTRLVLSAAINCSVRKREIYIERERDGMCWYWKSLSDGFVYSHVKYKLRQTGPNGTVARPHVVKQHHQLWGMCGSGSLAS